MNEAQTQPAKPAGSREGEPRRISLWTLLPYTLVTFGITWSILALYVFAPERTANAFGPLTGQHPLFFLAVWSPAIAAFIVVLRQEGLSGFRTFLSRVLIWRCSAGWYAFIFLGVPAIFYAGAALNGNLADNPLPIALGDLPLALMLMAIKGPIEEFGWRGLALPLLQRRMAPFWAALVVGVVWGLWHLPAFLLSGTPQGAWSFTPFFFGAIALSVVVTPLFNRSGGSILLPALFHFMLINPVFPDAQPYDTYLFGLAAAVIVWLNRRQMFGRQDAVTRVARRQDQPAQR